LIKPFEVQLAITTWGWINEVLAKPDILKFKIVDGRFWNVLELQLV
jgi:hypothetical protein